ncbi:hypothetical protein CCAX7_006630 [Capsulimonas corticalis]|uniref:Uncharacterized protein n=1 Tax=Capsulimonas corticalis TaxID=2219043 RepID=A0A402D1E5_9BACT|nr:alpha/beta hydrolase [Capsulimonas corticalis]BDI28612.1 hypothetical protein CCAX7_006630 [Capsulimonas corticalis]
MKTRNWIAPALVLAGLSTLPSFAQMPAKPDPQMKQVLDSLASLHPKPIETLTPAQARKQPGPPDAVKALLKKQGKSTAPEHVAKVENRTVPGPAGPIPVRVYTPEGSGPFPVLVYFHGGGWVIAGVQAYDSTPRALANLAKCVVVSVGYRMAPEHRFPAAHMDSYAATQYIMNHTAEFGGDPKHVAVGGESAGGNLAASVSIMARDKKGKMPVYQMLVYPVSNYGFDTPSYIENAKAKPLNKPMMKWFFKYTVSSPKDASNPYLSINREKNLHGLPPATVITDQIDPLRSEGKTYADHLKAAGVPVQYRNYDGVTHEFFGMGAVLDKAKAANAFAADGLKSAFSK